MQIIWKGQSCFQIITSRGKDSQVSLIIDPFNEECGLKVPNLSGDILLITRDHPNHNNIKAVSGQPFLINGLGEYDIKEVYIQGIPAFHDKNFGTPSLSPADRTIIYTIESEHMRICHMGDFGQKELFSEQLEDIGEIDILLIPVGGNETIGSVEAQKIISQIEPKIVIPMHYMEPWLSELKFDSLLDFIKEIGMDHETLDVLKIQKADLPPEERKLIVLNKK